MPSQRDLFMIIHIPQAKKRNYNLYKMSDSSFKLFVKKLRTGQESATFSSNLRLVKANELDTFNFNIFKEFNAQVKRLGQISHNRDLGLSLLGLEEDKDNAYDQLNLDKDNTEPDSEVTATLCSIVR